MANACTQAIVRVLLATAKLLQASRVKRQSPSSDSWTVEADLLEKALHDTATAISSIYRECAEDCGASFAQFDDPLETKFRYLELEALDIRDSVANLRKGYHRPDALRERVAEVGSVANNALNQWSRKVLKREMQNPSKVESSRPKGSTPTNNTAWQPPTPPPDNYHFDSNLHGFDDLEVIQPLNIAHNRQPPTTYVHGGNGDTHQQALSFWNSPFPQQPISPRAGPRAPRRAIQEAVEAAQRRRRTSSQSSANGGTSGGRSPVASPTSCPQDFDHSAPGQHESPLHKYSLIPRSAPTSDPRSIEAQLGRTRLDNTPVPPRSTSRPRPSGTHSPPPLARAWTNESGNPPASPINTMPYPMASTSNIANSPATPYGPHNIGNLLSRRKNSNTSASSSATPSADARDSNSAYQVFCPSAITLHSTTPNDKKALSVRTIPRGTTSTTTFIECATKSCTFQGPQTGTSKKKPSPDEKIITHPGTGIRCRWLFLAKSHLPCTEVDVGKGISPFTQAYGCLFCLDENRLVSRLVGIGALMTHILEEHSDDMPLDVIRRQRVLVGSVGRSEDDFELNVPRRRREMA